MKTPRRILECEKEYIGFIASHDDFYAGTRYRDSLLPDMYSYNFTYVNKALEQEEFRKLAGDEIALRKASGESFCNIVTDYTVIEDFAAGIEPKKTILGYYVFDISRLEDLCGSPDVSVKIVNNSQRAKDITELDCMNDKARFGEDFCRRRAERRVSIYLSDSPINSYVCYLGDEPVGSCDLTVMNRAAKIEEFAVLEKCQRRGYGTAILKDLIGRAADCGAELIYLVTDESDTAKDMYTKLGFSKVGERTELLYSW